MYNHKNFKNIRLADTGTRDTVTDLASGLATGQIDEGVSKLVRHKYSDNGHILLDHSELLAPHPKNASREMGSH